MMRVTLLIVSLIHARGSIEKWEKGSGGAVKLKSDVCDLVIYSVGDFSEHRGKLVSVLPNDRRNACVAVPTGAADPETKSAYFKRYAKGGKEIIHLTCLQGDVKVAFGEYRVEFDSVRIYPDFVGAVVGWYQALVQNEEHTIGEPVSSSNFFNSIYSFFSSKPVIPEEAKQLLRVCDTIKERQKVLLDILSSGIAPAATAPYPFDRHANDPLSATSSADSITYFGEGVDGAKTPIDVSPPPSAAPPGGIWGVVKAEVQEGSQLRIENGWRFTTSGSMFSCDVRIFGVFAGFDGFGITEERDKEEIMEEFGMVVQQYRPQICWESPPDPDTIYLDHQVSAEFVQTRPVVAHAPVSDTWEIHCLVQQNGRRNRFATLSGDKDTKDLLLGGVLMRRAKLSAGRAADEKMYETIYGSEADANRKLRYQCSELYGLWNSVREAFESFQNEMSPYSNTHGYFKSKKGGRPGKNDKNEKYQVSFAHSLGDSGDPLDLTKLKKVDKPLSTNIQEKDYFRVTLMDSSSAKCKIEMYLDHKYGSSLEGEGATLFNRFINSGEDAPGDICGEVTTGEISDASLLTKYRLQLTKDSLVETELKSGEILSLVTFPGGSMDSISKLFSKSDSISKNVKDDNLPKILGHFSKLKRPDRNRVAARYLRLRDVSDWVNQFFQKLHIKHSDEHGEEVNRMWFESVVFDSHEIPKNKNGVASTVPDRTVKMDDSFWANYRKVVKENIGTASIELRRGTTDCISALHHLDNLPSSYSDEGQLILSLLRMPLSACIVVPISSKTTISATGADDDSFLISKLGEYTAVIQSDMEDDSFFILHLRKKHPNLQAVASYRGKLKDVQDGSLSLDLGEEDAGAKKFLVVNRLSEKVDNPIVSRSSAARIAFHLLKMRQLVVSAIPKSPTVHSSGEEDPSESLEDDSDPPIDSPEEEMENDDAEKKALNEIKIEKGTEIFRVSSQTVNGKDDRPWYPAENIPANGHAFKIKDGRMKCESRFYGPTVKKAVNPSAFVLMKMRGIAACIEDYEYFSDRNEKKPSDSDSEKFDKEEADRGFDFWSSDVDREEVPSTENLKRKREKCYDNFLPNFSNNQRFFGGFILSSSFINESGSSQLITNKKEVVLKCVSGNSVSEEVFSEYKVDISEKWSSLEKDLLFDIVLREKEMNNALRPFRKMCRKMFEMSSCLQKLDNIDEKSLLQRLSMPARKKGLSSTFEHLGEYSSGKLNSATILKQEIPKINHAFLQELVKPKKKADELVFVNCFDGTLGMILNYDFLSRGYVWLVPGTPNGLEGACENVAFKAMYEEAFGKEYEYSEKDSFSKFISPSLGFELDGKFVKEIGWGLEYGVVETYTMGKVLSGIGTLKFLDSDEKDKKAQKQLLSRVTKIWIVLDAVRRLNNAYSFTKKVGVANPKTGAKNLLPEYWVNVKTGQLKVVSHDSVVKDIYAVSDNSNLNKRLKSRTVSVLPMVAQSKDEAASNIQSLKFPVTGSYYFCGSKEKRMLVSCHIKGQGVIYRMIQGKKNIKCDIFEDALLERVRRICSELAFNLEILDAGETPQEERSVVPGDPAMSETVQNPEKKELKSKQKQKNGEKNKDPDTGTPKWSERWTKKNQELISKVQTKVHSESLKTTIMSEEIFLWSVPSKFSTTDSECEESFSFEKNYLSELSYRPVFKESLLKALDSQGYVPCADSTSLKSILPGLKRLAQLESFPTCKHDSTKNAGMILTCKFIVSTGPSGEKFQLTVTRSANSGSNFLTSKYPGLCSGSRNNLSSDEKDRIENDCFAAFYFNRVLPDRLARDARFLISLGRIESHKIMWQPLWDYCEHAMVSETPASWREGYFMQVSKKLDSTEETRTIRITVEFVSTKKFPGKNESGKKQFAQHVCSHLRENNPFQGPTVDRVLPFRNPSGTCLSSHPRGEKGEVLCGFVVVDESSNSASEVNVVNRFNDCGQNTKSMEETCEANRSMLANALFQKFLSL